MKSKLRRKKIRTSSSKWPYLLFALAVVWYLMPGKSEVDAPAPQPEAPPVAQMKAAPIEPIPIAETQEAPRMSLDERRTRQIGASTFGISSLTTKSSDGYIDIPFVLEAKKVWCQAGDIDTIAYAIDSYDTKSLLVSIESLTGPPRKSNFRASLEELRTGIKRNFRIKSNGRGDSFGLFICRDADSSNSCKNKELVSHAVLSDRLAAKATKETAMKTDHIFYFQHLVMGEDSISTFKATDYLNTDSRALVQQLRDQFGLDEVEFKKAWRYSSVLQSLPARISDGSIILTLLQNDARCMQ